MLKGSYWLKKTTWVGVTGWVIVEASTSARFPSPLYCTRTWTWPNGVTWTKSMFLCACLFLHLQLLPPQQHEMSSLCWSPAWPRDLLLDVSGMTVHHFRGATRWASTVILLFPAMTLGSCDKMVLLSVRCLSGFGE